MVLLKEGNAVTEMMADRCKAKITVVVIFAVLAKLTGCGSGLEPQYVVFRWSCFNVKGASGDEAVVLSDEVFILNGSKFTIFD